VWGSKFRELGVEGGACCIHGFRAMYLSGGEAYLLTCKHHHCKPTRELKRHVRALACYHPEGWKMRGHVSPTITNYLIYRIGLFRVSGSEMCP
jgi:hypothetical protein